jgi:hypothetical protein
MSAFHRGHSYARNGIPISTVDYETEIRQSDDRFRVALAHAFARGDHLPADGKRLETADCPQAQISTPMNPLMLSSLVWAGV